jgi:hypothetical protein
LNNYASYGGGIDNAGNLAISNSTLADNSASSGGGIDNAYNAGTLTVSNSTVVSNFALVVAGIGGIGGGISNSGMLAIVNSTLANNSAAAHGGGIASGGTLTAVNDTIADNMVGGSSSGGGLDAYGGTATLDNTIVVGNTHAGAPDEIAGTVSSSSASNLIGTGGAGGLTDGINGNQVGLANPGLAALADNGGPTQTIALLLGSPAIDRGSNLLAVDPTTDLRLTTDQRGLGFPRISHNTVDIGAYELQVAPSVTIVGEQILTAGKRKHHRLVGFEILFSAALDPNRAQDAGNYTVTQTMIRMVKHHRTTVAQPIPIRVMYDAATHPVSLMLASKAPFAKGGQIVVKGSPPAGLTGTAGEYLDGSGAGVPGSDGNCTILPKGRGVVR